MNDFASFPASVEGSRSTTVGSVVGRGNGGGDETSDLRSYSKYHSALYDGEFLLRCALTHDWDHCIHFCEFLEEIFTVSVISRKQQWHQKRLMQSKRQLTAHDQWGNTALHAACFNNPPLRVISALLTAASASHLPIHALVSRDHSTPLLVACATGASLEVIRALTHQEQQQQQEEEQSRPQQTTSLVTRSDQMGGTPLSELTVHYELQRKSPMYSNARGGHNRVLPLDQVQLVNTFDNNNNNNNNLLDVFLQKVECLLQSAWQQQQQQQQPYISTVHGAAHVAASCPPVLTRLVLRGYPHMISFTNRNGVLPLHLCCCCLNLNYVPLSPTTLNEERSFAVSLSRHAYFVEQLLYWYPAAAQQVVPNCGGRLPFVQAIASGLLWHIPSTTTTTTTTTKVAKANDNNHNNNKNNNNKGPLQWLWEAYPNDAMARKDPVTGLYPVLLAATTTTTSTREENDVWATYQLDTIYCLLKLYPQVLTEAI